MLTSTFCHIRGISQTKEQRLWSAGVRSWDAFDAVDGVGLSPSQIDRLIRELDQSKQRLSADDPSYFADLLPAREHWRLFPEFRHHLAYLDIETTGLASYADQITTIALYDGRTIRHYIQGDNLDQFRKDIRQYEVIVTYNGKCFDVPFIQAAMGLRMEQVHIDLRYILASLGYRGGLKGCELKLGLRRDDLEGVDGYLAVYLWHEYQRSGNTRALETLLAYNIQDVLSLEQLLVIAYNKKLHATPLAKALRSIAAPLQPPVPFKADQSLIERLRRRYAWF